MPSSVTAGAGKTSLNEALLYQAGAVGRLGSVLDGTTVSDSAPDEKARQMSIAASLSSFEWRGRKVNLIDTPGDPSFVADTLAALRVCDAAAFVVSGVMGVEVNTERLWRRAADLGLARLVFVNMLDRERADFFTTLDSLKATFGPHVVATEIPIGSEHDVSGLVDLIDMKAYAYEGEGRDNCREVPIPEELRATAERYRERLMDEVAEVSDELMERYLDGEEISHDETVSALKNGVVEGSIFPVTCGVATQNLGTGRLLEAFVEDLPSPPSAGPSSRATRRSSPPRTASWPRSCSRRWPTLYAGTVNLFRVYRGVLESDTQVANCRTGHRERIGHLLVPQGGDAERAEEFGPGDIGAVAKLKDTHAGDLLADSADGGLDCELPELPSAVMSFAIEPKARGDEDKMFTALRRLQEEDPCIELRRDEQTGESIVAGLSQVHVEVIVERMRERFGAEVELRPPRVPYQETVRSPAKAHGRYKKQSGGRGQFGDCHIEIEPPRHGAGFSREPDKGRRDPVELHPRRREGRARGDGDGRRGRLSRQGRPGHARGRLPSLRGLLGDGLQGGRVPRVQAGDGERRTRPARADHAGEGLRAGGRRGRGDRRNLNSRRGRPFGMEPKGAATEIGAEVPMAEILSYAPDLRALTGGAATTRWSSPPTRSYQAHLVERVVGAASGREERVHA